mgnify:FL=1
MYRGLCTSLFYRHFCPKYRNRKCRKMYTDMLQNDIIIISKKDKTKNWVRTIGHKKEDYIYTINIEKG